MCDVPSIAVFCSESFECFPGTASKFFLRLLVTIPVAPIITGIIVHFRFHIHFISVHKLLCVIIIIIIIIIGVVSVCLLPCRKVIHFLCIYNTMLQKMCTCRNCLYFGLCHLRSVCIHRCQAGMFTPAPCMMLQKNAQIIFIRRVKLWAIGHVTVELKSAFQ